MTSGPETYAGRRRAGSASEDWSRRSPKEEPIADRRPRDERRAPLEPFRPSGPYRRRSGRAGASPAPNWDPNRLLRWILAAVVVIVLGSAFAVIIALVISFG